MSKNSYLEQDAIIVVASALNKSLKTLPRRSSKLDSPESFLVSKEVLHASRFELKEETKDSTQKAFPNRFSNAATTLLLQGMESEFLKISSHGDFSPRQQHLALELHNNATYSLSVAGTKHTMTVETFTRESIRERLEALRRKDPEWVQWSENRYLRLCLKNAANIEVPKKLRSLFPALVQARGRSEPIPRMYVDIGITFHSKYDGFSLIVPSTGAGKDMFKSFIEDEPPGVADPPNHSWEDCASDPKWDDWVQPDPMLDAMSHAWHSQPPSTGTEEGSEANADVNDDDTIDGEEEGCSSNQQSITTGNANTTQDNTTGDNTSQDSTNEGEMSDEEDILDQMGTDDLQDAYFPDDWWEDDEENMLNMLQVTGKSTSRDRRYKLPWSEFVMNFLPIIVNIHSGKMEAERSEMARSDSEGNSSSGFCIAHPENGRAHGGQLYQDGLRTIERRQDTKRWEVLVGLGAAVATYFQEGNPSDEVVQKIRKSLHQLKPAIDDVKKLFRTSQGTGVRMEWFSRCDSVFDSNEATLNFNTPPLVPLCLVDQKVLAGMFSAVTDLYFNPLLRAFPDTVLREEGRLGSGVARLERNHYSPAAQTTLTLFAEICASQFANLPFAYNGTIMKTMKSELLHRNSRYIRVPNHLRMDSSPEEKNVLALPFVVSPRALVLPSLSVALQLFEENSIPRSVSVGVSCGLSMALSKAAFFRGQTALPVTYEVRMTVIRKILFVFSYFGT